MTRPEMNTLSDIAERLISIRSMLNPAKHHAMWDELSQLSEDIKRLNAPSTRSLELHKCRIKHDPPNSYGDCLRACIASLLGCSDVLEVPHFLHDGNEEETRFRLRVFLEPHGWHLFTIALDGDSATIENIGEMMTDANPNQYYLLFGSVASGGSHVVIRQNHVTIWNPDWSNDPIVKPSSEDGMYVIGILTPVLTLV